MLFSTQRASVVSAALILNLFGLSACGSDDTEIEIDGSWEGDRPVVVTTSTIITDLTTQVGGDAIDLTGILQPGSDPHQYEPGTQDRVTLENADLILYNGYNLEPALIKMAHGTTVKAVKVGVAETIVPLDIQQNGLNIPNPHVWINVDHAIAMTDTIRDALIDLSPDDQVIFTRNAEQLTTDLGQLHAWIETQIATIPQEQRTVATLHEAFAYYAEAYGLSIFTTTPETPEAQANSPDWSSFAASLNAAGVTTLFLDTTNIPQPLETLAEDTGMTLLKQPLYSDSSGTPIGPSHSYINMMVSSTETIVNSLGGQITPWGSPETSAIATPTPANE